MQKYFQRLGAALLSREITPTALISDLDAEYKRLERLERAYKTEWRDLLVRYERANDKTKFLTDQRDALADLIQKSYEFFKETQRFHRDVYRALDKQADILEETLKRKVPTW